MTHPKRESIQHCFRISLRKFLIWLVLLGGGIGWLVSQAVRQEQIIESIEPFGQVLFDYQLDERGRRSKFEKSRPAWLKHPRSRSLFSSVVEFRSFGLTHSCFLDLYSQLNQLKHLAYLDLNQCDLVDEDIAMLAELRALKWLRISGSKYLTVECIKELVKLRKLRELHASSLPISNNELELLLEIPKLDCLSLGNTKIDDDGMDMLVNKGGFILLDLSGTSITDRGISKLCQMATLMSLDISNTKITDECIFHLSALNQLHTLNVRNTFISSEGLKALVDLIPNTNVIY